MWRKVKRTRSGDLGGRPVVPLFRGGRAWKGVEKGVVLGRRSIGGEDSPLNVKPRDGVWGELTVEEVIRLSGS